MNAIRILTVLGMIALMPFGAQAGPLPATLYDDVAACQAGVERLHASAYVPPGPTATFKTAFDAFNGAPSKACNDAVTYIMANRSEPELAAASAVVPANAGHWVEEILAQGAGVIGYCPHKDTAQFNCSQGAGRIAAGVDGLRKMIGAVRLPADEIKTLKEKAALCEAGGRTLEEKMYNMTRNRDPKVDFQPAYQAFNAQAKQACAHVKSYVQAHRNHWSLAAMVAAVDAYTLNPFEQIDFQASRVFQYCPNLHRKRFDCVNAGNVMTRAVRALRAMSQAATGL